MNYACLRYRTHQAGIAAVELAVVVIFFFTFVFATLELARIEYLLNTLMEVTRRAAAGASTVNFKDATALQTVQAKAVFRDTAGELPLGHPVTTSNVIIDYLSVSKNTLDLKHVTALPSCPARNRWNCIADPYGDSCIRFVRARICASMDNAGNCQPLSFQMMFPFLNLSKLHIPTAETIVPAGSLGEVPGTVPCP